MRIFLLWRRASGPGARLEPERVARSLQEVLRPLFATPPPVSIEQNAAAAMVFLELPVHGWGAPFVQEDAHGRAYAIDQPIGVRRVLGARGTRPGPDAELPALGRALAEDPAPVLAELAPPLLLLWWPRDRDEVLLQTDGLGRAQLYEYDDGALWAATNKVAALRALGVEPKLDTLGWAAKCAIGWFPMAHTGVAHLTHAGPGTQLRVGPDGLRRRTDDVLREWVHPPRMARDDALELARASLIRHVRDAADGWTQPVAGLTGGWDTRAVVSSLVAAGVDVPVKVKGREGSLDVSIAQRLAELAGLDLEVQHTAELPPHRPEDLETCMRRALLWQAGHMWSENHKTFLWEGRSVDGGHVNVMGQHGEVGRGALERRIKAWNASGDHDHEDLLLVRLLHEEPPGLRPEVLDAVRDLMRASFRQAAAYGLSGLAAVDFTHLIEATRRSSGASLSGQFGMAVTPFLNPDFIRAAYALRAAGEVFVRDRRLVNPLHRHIVERNLPAWADVEIEDDVFRAARRAARRARDGTTEPVPPAAARDWRAPRARDYYDYEAHWEQVGRPLAVEVAGRDGFWTEIFDPARIRASGGTPPVELVIAGLAGETLAAVPAGPGGGRVTSRSP